MTRPALAPLPRRPGLVPEPAPRVPDCPTPDLRARAQALVWRQRDPEFLRRRKWPYLRFKSLGYRHAEGGREAGGDESGCT